MSSPQSGRRSRELYRAEASRDERSGPNQLTRNEQTAKRIRELLGKNKAHFKAAAKNRLYDNSSVDAAVDEYAKSKKYEKLRPDLRERRVRKLRALVRERIKFEEGILKKHGNKQYSRITDRSKKKLEHDVDIEILQERATSKLLDEVDAAKFQKEAAPKAQTIEWLLQEVNGDLAATKDLRDFCAELMEHYTWIKSNVVCLAKFIDAIMGLESQRKLERSRTELASLKSRIGSSDKYALEDFDEPVERARQAITAAQQEMNAAAKMITSEIMDAAITALARSKSTSLGTAVGIANTIGNVFLGAGSVAATADPTGISKTALVVTNTVKPSLDFFVKKIYLKVKEHRERLGGAEDTLWEDLHPADMAEMVAYEWKERIQLALGTLSFLGDWIPAWAGIRGTIQTVIFGIIDTRVKTARKIADGDLPPEYLAQWKKKFTDLDPVLVADSLRGKVKHVKGHKMETLKEAGKELVDFAGNTMAPDMTAAVQRAVKAKEEENIGSGLKAQAEKMAEASDAGAANKFRKDVPELAEFFPKEPADIASLATGSIVNKFISMVLKRVPLGSAQLVSADELKSKVEMAIRLSSTVDRATSAKSDLPGKTAEGYRIVTALSEEQEYYWVRVKITADEIAEGKIYRNSNPKWKFEEPDINEPQHHRRPEKTAQNQPIARFLSGDLMKSGTTGYLSYYVEVDDNGTPRKGRVTRNHQKGRWYFTEEQVPAYKDVETGRGRPEDVNGVPILRYVRRITDKADQYYDASSDVYEVVVRNVFGLLMVDKSDLSVLRFRPLGPDRTKVEGDEVWSQRSLLYEEGKGFKKSKVVGYKEGSKEVKGTWYMPFDDGQEILFVTEADPEGKWVSRGAYATGGGQAVRPGESNIGERVAHSVVKSRPASWNDFKV